MKVIPIPCLSDNYAYLVVCQDTGQAGVVDPSEAAPVLEAIRREGVECKAILNTHHHWDHIGGNKELLAEYPRLAVYAHKSDRGRIDGQTEELDTGDTFQLGKLTFRALHNPGHTSGAVSYVVEDCVFTGDTLFAAGCGRLLEGTPAMMYDSLHKVIGSLPDATRVFFGHEYTEKNLAFAVTVEPDNDALRKRLASVKALRREKKITTPSLLRDEWAINPFMRCDSDAIKARVKQEHPANDLSPVAVLAVVRGMKDKF